MKIIDVHTHYFNLRFFPISGVIKRYLPWMPSIAATAFEKIINSILEVRDRKDINVALIEEENFHMQLIETEEFRSVLNEGDHLLINQGYHQLEDELLMVQGGEKVSDLIAQSKSIVSFVFNALASSAGLPNNIVNWIKYMFRTQEEILQDAMSKFSNIEMTLNSIFDTEPSFGGKSKLRFRNQIDQTLSNIETAGINSKLLVGFNPLDKNSLSVIRDYADHEKVCGVKYYPPLGHNPEFYYLPKRNDTIAVHDDKDYIDYHRNLFRLCHEKGLVVFLHCTIRGGFGDLFRDFFFTHDEAVVQARYNNSPWRWSQLLSDFPEVNVCFGHAGGEDGWFSENIENEAHLTGDLMRVCRYHKNAFMEVGFLNDILEGGEKSKNFEKNLKKVLVDFDLGPQLMFGTDWHTLMNENVNGKMVDQSYVQKFIEIFKKKPFDQFTDDFFHRNAENFLKLKPDEV